MATHIAAPVPQATAPTWHATPVAHAAPDEHAMQPASGAQTAFVPHGGSRVVRAGQIALRCARGTGDRSHEARRSRRAAVVSGVARETAAVAVADPSHAAGAARRRERDRGAPSIDTVARADATRQHRRAGRALHAAADAAAARALHAARARHSDARGVCASARDAHLTHRAGAVRTRGPRACALVAELPFATRDADAQLGRGSDRRHRPGRRCRPRCCTAARRSRRSRRPGPRGTPARTRHSSSRRAEAARTHRCTASCRSCTSTRRRAQGRE